jgi:CheY-like chemotaxis protein
MFSKRCRRRMTATSRFKTERPIPPERERCLVALVGLRRSLRTNARSLLQRCELQTLELPDPSDACRLLETLAPDAIVLDTHHPSLQQMSSDVVRLLHALNALGRDGQFVPRIILSSAGLAPELRLAFVRGGAVLLPAHFQHYRRIAVLVRRLCGLPEDCCVGGDSPNSPFNASAIAPLHARH